MRRRDEGGRRGGGENGNAEDWRIKEVRNEMKRVEKKE